MLLACLRSVGGANTSASAVTAYRAENVSTPPAGHA
jgi:hypothetical protein